MLAANYPILQHLVPIKKKLRHSHLVGEPEIQKLKKSGRKVAEF